MEKINEWGMKQNDGGEDTEEDRAGGGRRGMNGAE